eukprot:TRINITY_DN26924_c0_g1_i1.p1 TRINITY_DN26924_c0_g1~~TRINITY_DN26924_c0_g1_i1.p1  ORF type:complete len:349 (+),score=61.47 TRINITY_DN26924_c0_g1_i1:345-1391(+)
MGLVFRQGVRGCCVKRKDRALTRTINHAANVCKLLRKLSSQVRREIICNRLTQKQRLALETHMVAEKNNRPEKSVTAESILVMRDSKVGGHRSCGQEASRGICKRSSRDKVLGYYAQAGINNFTFYTRTQCDLASTLTDHIILLRILAHIWSSHASHDFPSKVRTAVACVLQEEGLAQREFLRAFRVSFSAIHWVGRHLLVNRNTLDAALDAWYRFDSLRGPRLFWGAQVSEEYTPERAREHWAQAREIYIQLQVEAGRQSRAQVEQSLASQEAQRQTMEEQAASRWRQDEWKRQQRQAGREAAEKISAHKLLHRIEKLVFFLGSCNRQGGAAEGSSRAAKEQGTTAV